MRASLAASVLMLFGGIAVGQQPAGSSYNVRPVTPAYYQGATPTVTTSDPIALPVLPSPFGAMPVVSSSTPTTAQWVAPAKIAPLIVRTSGTSVPGLVRQGKTQKGAAEEDRPEYQVQTNPPGLKRLSQLDSDAKLEERIRQETLERTKNEQVVFPEEPILSREVYMGRVGLWPTRELIVEPNYVAYQKLYFQQNNFERFGWDLGPITPLVCATSFLYDLVTVPITFGARPCERDASTGYPLPGDPVPLLLYPPEITLTGVVLEVGALSALAAIFP
jgi:hypothetical protein